MRRHHPDCPSLWLMTDERMGDGLWAALDRLPRGAGVIFRHYSLPLAQRHALFAAIVPVARRRRLLLLRGGTAPFRHEQGVHGRSATLARGFRSWPAHNLAEVIAGRRAGADVILISPVFATRSHVGAQPLGVVRAARLARASGGRAIALGGMTAATAQRLKETGFSGWAAIDAWLDDGFARV